ncbi:MAG: ABC transporter ATP-binding protein [Planctomycetes bacterium]|nr:ABC transporter ATP-binding protein [Planctomycetota bacterium]
MPNPVLHTRGLTKRYGATLALDALDLSVEAGEVFGFLGPNGAGKTTTIRLLLDLIRPTSGEALLFGRPPRDPAVRARIGYLPGDLVLDPRLSGSAMLDVLDALRGRGAPPGDARRRAELCERLLLDARDLARPVREASRGTRQKMGLVAAFQHDPELLVLDEPTGGLDPLVREAFFELLDDTGRRGRTVFHSSHVLSEVERTCARAAILRQGRLVVVERIATMRAALPRRMTLRFDAAPPDDVLRAPGVAVLERDGGRVVLRVGAELGPLLAALARTPPLELVFPEAELEDAFAHLYDGSAADAEDASRTPSRVAPGVRSTRTSEPAP